MPSHMNRERELSSTGSKKIKLETAAKKYMVMIANQGCIKLEGHILLHENSVLIKLKNIEMQL